MKANIISISIPSETAPLKKVVLCLANPVSIYPILRYGVIDKAALYQLWHNRFAFYNYKKVRQQQEALMKCMKVNGVEVLLADEMPGCATQHYIRDIGFAIDDTFFCASPRRFYRKRELEGLRNILPRFSRVAQLEKGSIEGGDVIVDDDFIIVGLGEETNKEGIESLRRKLRELRIDREIVAIEFSHRGIIHLDTKFNIVSNSDIGASFRA